MLIEMSKISGNKNDAGSFINPDAIAYLGPVLGSDNKDTLIVLNNSKQAYISNKTPRRVVETLREFGVQTSHL